MTRDYNLGAELKTIFWLIWLVLFLAALARCQTVSTNEIRMTGVSTNYAPMAGRYRMGINTTTGKYFCVTPTGADCMPTSTGGGTTTIVQVNGVNLTTQSPVNISGTSPITVANTSAGNVVISLTGAFAASGANSDITNLTGLAFTNLSTSGIAIGTTGSNGIWFSDANHINFAPNGADFATMVGTSNIFRLRNNGIFGWTSATTSLGGPADTGLSRNGVGIIAAGNGTAGNASGTLQAGLFCLGATTSCWTSNAGSPNGFITASPGAVVSDVTNGQLYIKNTGTGNTGWGLVTSGSGGTGTVTSVALSTAGVLFSVTGSPVTTSGTLGLTLNTQSPNLVFAGPSSGSAATPTFRALTAADLPAANDGYMTADSTASTSTTMANLTGLAMTLAASTNYEVSCNLFYQVSASTGGLVLQFTGPASPTNVMLGSQQMLSTTSLREDSITTYGAKFNSGNALTSATTTNLLVEIRGTVENGTTAGTLQLQYANAAAAVGSVTVKRGSFCKATVI